MIKNYIKTAWRNLINTKFYSSINIVGLTIGLAVGMLILIWVADELSYNKFNSKADHIYKVNASIGSGASKQVWGGVPPPVAYHALKAVPGVVNAARVMTSYDYSTFKYKDKLLKEDYGRLSFIDASFFNVFDYKLIKGNRKLPFPNDRSVILTETTAKKYFGDEDPMGKIIAGDSRDPYTVSGVLADFPSNSSINYNMLFSIAVKKNQYNGRGYWKSMDEDWGNYYTDTYLEIRPDASVAAIANKLTKIHMALHTGIKPTDGIFGLQPLSDIHLYNPDGSESGMQTVRIFAIVAALILLIACINYVNLSTARAMLRAKEVSVRKIIGAERKHLFLQFILETAFCFVIAMILAFALICLVLPFYNQLAGKKMHFDLFDKNVWRVVGLTMAGTLIASSIYPAILLSSFKPISALKGKVSGIGSATFRKVLVVCQFAFSIGLIIGTLVINKQLQFVRSEKLGYDREYVFSLQMHGMEAHYEAIKAELLRRTEIKGITTGNNSIVSSGSNTSDTDWDGKPADLSFLINPFEIDKDFINLFNIKFAAGKNFSGTKSDSANFILNETAVKVAGIKNPVGKRFKLHDLNGTIIGVVKDFHFASLRQTIAPSIFVYRPTTWQMYVKTTGKDAPAAIKAIEKYWHQYNANFPFEYSFLDDQYNDMYKSEQQTGTLFSIFAGIAIFISCLGLFGLATYTAQIKIKEIGIRKVLGASVVNITTMLSKDFLLLVIISLVIAGPIAWYAMNKWLEDYAYRVSLSWTLIPLAGISALLIALITISFQAVKAALTNPVKSLRSE
jgi:putative ABC transport system permease protein